MAPTKYFYIVLMFISLVHEVGVIACAFSSWHWSGQPPRNVRLLVSQYPAWSLLNAKQHISGIAFEVHRAYLMHVPRAGD